MILVETGIGNAVSDPKTVEEQIQEVINTVL
jgi:hypothetical protein